MPLQIVASELPSPLSFLLQQLQRPPTLNPPPCHFASVPNNTSMQWIFAKKEPFYPSKSYFPLELCPQSAHYKCILLLSQNNRLCSENCFCLFNVHFPENFFALLLPLLQSDESERHKRKSDRQKRIFDPEYCFKLCHVCKIYVLYVWYYMCLVYFRPTLYLPRGKHYHISVKESAIDIHVFFEYSLKLSHVFKIYYMCAWFTQTNFKFAKMKTILYSHQRRASNICWILLSSVLACMLCE